MTKVETDYRSTTVQSYSNTQYSGGESNIQTGTITDLKSGATYYYDVPKADDKDSDTATDGDEGAFIVNSKGQLIGVDSSLSVGEIPTTSPEDADSDSIYLVSDDGSSVGKLKNGANLKDGIQASDLDLVSEEDCNKNDACSTLFNQKSLQTTFSSLSSIVGQIGSTQYFSSLLGADDWIPKALGFENIEAWDRWFSGTVLAEGYFESLICKSKYPDIQSADGVFVDDGSGFQSVGSVNGEISYRENAQPILCYPNEEGDYACPIFGKDCSAEGYCIDNNEEIVEGYLYKFSWGIRAPSDKSLTPYSDESYPGHVSYNIVVYKNDLSEPEDINGLTGTLDSSCASSMSGLESDIAGGDPTCIPLYVDGSANTRNPLVLLGGEGDGQTVMVWSTLNTFESICIHWSDAPLTYTYGGVDGLFNMNQLTKNELGSNGAATAPSYCSKVIDLEIGTVGLENFEDLESKYSTTSSASNTAGSESVTTADVGTTIGTVSFP